MVLFLTSCIVLFFVSKLKETIHYIGFLDQISCLEASEICGNFLIVAPLSLVNQWHPEAETWAPDMVAIIYHGYADSGDFLVQHKLFYTDQFMPKVYASKMKRQHIIKVSKKSTTMLSFVENVA